MAVFRIEKTRDYTVMSNHHLRDKSLSLKAKGRVFPSARPAVRRRAPGGARGEGGNLRKPDGRPHFRPG